MIARNEEELELFNVSHCTSYKLTFQVGPRVAPLGL